MAVAGAAPVTTIHQDLIRLETISQLLESTAGALAAGPNDPIASWFAPWAHRLLVARSAVDRWRAREGSTDAGRAADEETQRIDRRQSKLTRRLGIGSLTIEPSASRPLADDALDIWNQSDGASQSVAGYYVHGFGPNLALALPSRGLNEFAWRFITAILGTAVVRVYCFGFAGKPGRWTSLNGWPAILGVAAGLFWWLEMEPSWLGLAIVAASLIVALRSRRIARESINPAGA